MITADGQWRPYVML